MPGNSTQNWHALQAALAPLNPPPAGLALPAARARDVATFTAPDTLPAGFVDITGRLKDKGFIPQDSTRLVATRQGSRTAADIVDAIFRLPGTPLSANILTGFSAELMSATLTLVKHDVIPEGDVAQQAHAHFEYANRAPTDKLAHMLAALGEEHEQSPLDDTQGIGLAERFRMLAAAGFSPTAADCNGLTAAHHAAANDNLAALKALETIGVNIHGPNAAGMTPLHAASEHRATATLAYLTQTPAHEAGHDELASLVDWVRPAPDQIHRADHRGRTAAQLALTSARGEHHPAAYRNTSRLLQQAGAGNLVERGNVERMAREGTAANIHGLIEAGGLNDRFSRQNLVREAVRHGNAETARALFESLSNDEQFATLHNASREGMWDHSAPGLQTFLALTGANINLRNSKNQNLLEAEVDSWSTFACIKPDHFQYAEHLVRAGVDVPASVRSNLIDHAIFGSSMHRRNSDRGSMNGIAYLTRAGLLTQPDPQVQRAFDLHLTQRELRPIKNLIAAGGIPDPSSARKIIVLGASLGDAGFLKWLAARGWNLDQPGRSGQSVLQACVLNNKPQAVRALVAAGANIDLRGTEGGSALHMLAQSGNLEMMGLLKQLGADLTLRDDAGLTPYQLAKQIHGRSEGKARFALLKPEPEPGPVTRLFSRLRRNERTS